MHKITPDIVTLSKRRTVQGKFVFFVAGLIVVSSIIGISTDPATIQWDAVASIAIFIGGMVIKNNYDTQMNVLAIKEQGDRIQQMVNAINQNHKILKKKLKVELADLI